MESSEISFTQPLWVDLLFWSAGAVFLNRVVLVKLWGPTAEGQAGPSLLLRYFFLLVFGAVVVLLAMIVAGGPLLSRSSAGFSTCWVNHSVLVVLVLCPVVLFTLQAALFHGWANRSAGKKGVAVLVSLVATSAVLVFVMAVTRDTVFLPELCRSSPNFFARGYRPPDD